MIYSSSKRSFYFIRSFLQRVLDISINFPEHNEKLCKNGIIYVTQVFYKIYLSYFVIILKNNINHLDLKFFALKI